MKYRLALYSPDPDDHELTPIRGTYRDTASDRAEMREVIREYNRLAKKRLDVTLCLGIFPVKRKGVSA